MTDQSDPRAGIEAAIAALEAQRPVLGDVAVDAALAGLRQKLGELEQAERRPKPAEPRADTAERKFVTVLFADISGFTALSEITDPESVRDIINACFDTFVPIVVRYGGTVDKFIGDEIMALFGAPASHEDDPARALFAALDMMSALKLFNRQRETDLGVHIGINSGLVIAGGLGSKGRQQYSVMGDPVNVAARLETLSDTGQIFVGPDTYQLVEHLFDFEALPPVAIKGKHKLLPIYQLLRPKRESETGRGLSGLRSPLVGRELQMDRLLGLMADLSQGRGRTIAIAGEAGIGKSRLIAELRNESSADNDWIEGRALSYTDCMGYWTARNLLQNLLGVAEDADLEEVGRRLNKAVAEACPDELAEVYPYLGHFLDVPLEQSMVERVLYLEPQQLQSRVHRAFETFIKARALCYPQILVWEDLHWSDPSSLNMLGSLMHLPQECPLLMLLLFRPRESDRIWEWHQKLSEDYPESYETISLEPLSRGDSGRLVANLLHIEGLPEETRQLLLDKSEGNPFFLEEILRSLLDAGIVVLEGRRARAKRAISHVDVPNTLQGVIAARVDRLPAGDKQTLQMAAVIGRIFQQSVLAFLAEQQQCAGGLEESLDLFQYRELVNPYHGRSFGLEYIFKHALTQEVTYRSLLRSRRRTLHKNTALAIEETFPEHLTELAPTLAYHYEQASAPEQAIPLLKAAAKAAKKLYAHEEAIVYYRRALNLIEPLFQQNQDEWQPSLVELGAYLGDLLIQTGDYQGAREIYIRTLERISESAKVEQALLLSHMGNSWNAQRLTDKGILFNKQALQLLEPRPVVLDASWWEAWLNAKIELVWSTYLSNDKRGLAQQAEEIIDLVERHGTDGQKSRFYAFVLPLAELVHSRWYLLPDSFFDNQNRFLKQGQKDGNLKQVLSAHWYLGFGHMWSERLDEAKKQFQLALPLARRINHAEFKLMSSTYLTLTARMQGDIESVRTLVGECQIEAEAQNSVSYLGMAQANIAWLAWHKADKTAAYEGAQEALRIWKKISGFTFTYLARFLILALEFENNNLEGAISQAQGIIEPENKRLPVELEETLRRGVEAWHAADTSVTHRHLATAISLAQETGYF